MWCPKRITSQDLLLRFQDGKHRFYLESVCGRAVAGPEGSLCDYCSHLKPQTKTQDVRTFPHGLVTGEYPPESHIFGGPWYEAKVKAYGPPTESEIELAMEAQRRAKEGRRVTSLQELVVLTPVETKENPKTKVKSKTKAKAVERTKEEPPLVSTSVVEQLAEQVLNKIPATAKMVETLDDVLRVESVCRITLRPFEHEGVLYWKDEETGNVYERKASGKRGAKVMCV